MNTLLEDIEEIVSKNIKVNHKVELKSNSKDSKIIITVGDLKLTYYVEAMTMWISSKINLRDIDVDNKELEQFCSMYSDIKNLQEELFTYFDKQKINESVEQTSMTELIQKAKEKGIKPRDIFSSYKYVTDPVKFLDILTDGMQKSYREKAYKRIELNRDYEPFYKALKAFIEGRPVTRIEPALIDKDNKPIDGRHRAALCDLLGINLPLNRIEEK